MIVLSLLALGLALLPALIYLGNLRQFRPPPTPDGVVPAVSVLIPARNEERSIGPAVVSVLASEGVDLEVIVLDDHSTDGTAAVVQGLAARDARVRLAEALPLPAGWCGKQHACHALSQLARHDVFAFIDADVRLSPDAVARMAAFLRASGGGLVSGFPRQETGTWLEKLVLPLINWLLVCYLPMGPMRRLGMTGLGAGCGQFFMTTREAYQKAGTHAAVRASLHDGVTLPRAYRRAGLLTDVCDATDLATCRMYRSAGQVWHGLSKNAGEGLGAWPGIVVWTVLLFGGHVLPFVILPVIVMDAAISDSINAYYFAPDYPGVDRLWVWIPAVLSGVACVCSLVPRLAAARQFRASLFGAVLHPVGVLLLVAIQWYALARRVVGRPVGWKGRTHPSLPMTPDAPPR